MISTGKYSKSRGTDGILYCSRFLIQFAITVATPQRKLIQVSNVSPQQNQYYLPNLGPCSLCAYYITISIIQIKSMRKSSSVQLFPLEFNPKDFKVGHSKIDQLPLRRHSASHLPIAQLSNYQNEIQRLKKHNAALLRENQQLRRELECLKVTTTTGTVYRTEEKVKQYKDRIRDKLSSRVKQSRNTECQTGLLSSKQISIEPSSLTISDYYDQYKLSQRIPSLLDLQDIADRFFKDYCQSYAKLKCLFDCLQCSKQQEMYKRLYDLIDLYKVPLLYQKSPQTLLREISKSKQRVKTKQREEISRSKKEKEDICWQILSPKETVLRTQTLLGKVCKSDQMLKALKNSENVRQFIQKIKEKF